MLGFEFIVLFLLLGLLVGLMAGLLGIGGGALMVPMLTSIFLLQGVPTEKVMHLALGTSMASIIATSFASLRAHHKVDGVIWDIVKRMAVGVVLGTFCSTFLASYISSLYLAVFFVVFMVLVAVQMFFNQKPQLSRELPNTAKLLMAGSGIGAVSALVSIGGGSLMVPYLTWQNVEIKKAIGTSAAIGLPISIAGTLGYLVNGWGMILTENYTFGFIYLPAVLLISTASFFTAPLGAKLAHNLPVAVLKKCFALLLILLALKMLWSLI